jgi:hypothetical protein
MSEKIIKQKFLHFYYKGLEKNLSQENHYPAAALFKILVIHSLIYWTVFHRVEFAPVQVIVFLNCIKSPFSST